MSTHDVPGYRAQNQDSLASGCWAEHGDGSLIVVGSVDAGYVRYLVFDRSEQIPSVFADAMPETEFMEQFSAPKSPVVWTWHDKTPFPWGMVVEPRREASTSAKTVAKTLGLTPHKLQPEFVRRLVASHSTDGGNRNFIEAFDVLASK